MKLKKLFTLGASVVFATLVLSGCKEDKNQTDVATANNNPTELVGDITMWHSFTQGPRLEVIQAAANDFMQKNPKVRIKIETFSWNDFYTKWTTGLASGNVPDLSSALPNQVIEMINVEALTPLNDVIDTIGRERFSPNAIKEGTVGENNYSIPLYSHAKVLWVRKDLLEKNGLAVPQTWEELYQAAKTLTKEGVYGLSVPMGTNDYVATIFLDLYIRSGGGTLLTKEHKVDLTNPLAQEAINYWVKMYKETSPKDSVNYNILQQATLFYQGKAAFDFNSGFHIGGVKANSPNLLAHIDAYPVPKRNINDPQGASETLSFPLVVWKNSKHPEIAKAFITSLYEKERYIAFLNAVPVGMLPAITGVENEPAYTALPIRQEFKHAEQVIQDAVNIGSAIGYEYGPNVYAGLLTNQHIIEAMFQDIVVNGTDPMIAAQKAEQQLNTLFEAITQ